MQVIFHITHKKEERKEQLHHSAQATAAPSGRFSQVPLSHFEHKRCQVNFIFGAHILTDQDKLATPN